MKRIILLSILLTYAYLICAYEWTPIGPDSIKVNNYLASSQGQVLCADEGLFLEGCFNWMCFNDVGLPVKDALEIENNQLLVLMGNGSYSDGIYLFDLVENNFSVVAFFLLPEFIYTANNVFYVGGQHGMISSENGSNWDIVEFFINRNLTEMCSHGENYVITTTEYVCFSNNAGETWNQAGSSLLPFSDITVDYDGVFYAIFPGMSWSSGLWKSVNGGSTWEVIFWDCCMSSVLWEDNQIYVCWDDTEGQGTGVARWNSSTNELVYMNNNLPDLIVNKLERNIYIDCFNMIACTNSGAYFTVLFVNNSEISLVEKNNIQCYPNPFSINNNTRNQNLSIRYELPTKNESAEINIFNLIGQKIMTSSVKVTQKENIFNWDGKNSKGTYADTGIYFVTIKSGDYFSTQKIALIK